VGIVDLHLHTRESDGTDTPEQLIRKAKESNITFLSITDHNVVSAYHKLAGSEELTSFTGRIITGVEFCTSFNSLPIEVLGYGFHVPAMQRYIDRFFHPADMDRKEREIFRASKEKLLKRGFKLDPDLKYVPPFATEALEKELWKYPENLSRMPEKLARYPELLCRYMNDPGCDLYAFDSYFPSCEEVVAGIHEAGGLAFLAHPYTYLVQDPGKLAEDAVIAAGFDGVEVFYALHSKENVVRLLEIADRYRLFVSGGSDYHGKNKPHIQMGTGLGDLSVPQDIIDLWSGAMRFK